MKSSAVTATVIASGVGGLNAIADAVRTTDALATSLNIVGQQARPILNEYALSIEFGFGGVNASVLSNGGVQLINLLKPNKLAGFKCGNLSR